MPQTPPEAKNPIEGERTPFASETRVVVCIPCRESEKSLAAALYTYLRLDPIQRKQIELCILINTDKGEASPLKRQIQLFSSSHPDLKITSYTHAYEEEIELSQVRRDLFDLVQEKASLSEGEAPIVVSQNADLLELSSEYFAGILGQFAEDPNLDAIAGFVDYPFEDFHQDHLFFAVQLFEDIFEQKLREKTGAVLARGGNAAFRMNALSKPGVQESFEASDAPIYLQTRKKAEGVNIKGNDMLWVANSARRQMSALGANPPVLLAERYRHSIEFILSESAHKVTSESFSPALEQELTGIYTELLKNCPYDLSPDELTALFVDAGREMDIPLEISGVKVLVKDKTALRSRILKDFSTF